MQRAMTVSTAFVILAPVLVALQLLTSLPSFTSAHTPRHAVAKAAFDAPPSGTASYDETATCHDPGPPGDPTGPLRTRDRQRTADNPPAPDRPIPPHRASAAPRPGAPASADPPPAGSSVARSLTALQVFRC